MIKVQPSSPQVVTIDGVQVRALVSETPQGKFAAVIPQDIHKVHPDKLFTKLP